MSEHLIFFCHGKWHCVSWPYRGCGDTPRAAEVDMRIKRFLKVRG